MGRSRGERAGRNPVRRRFKRMRARIDRAKINRAGLSGAESLSGGDPIPESAPLHEGGAVRRGTGGRPPGPFRRKRKSGIPQAVGPGLLSTGGNAQGEEPSSGGGRLVLASLSGGDEGGDGTACPLRGGVALGEPQSGEGRGGARPLSA